MVACHLSVSMPSVKMIGDDSFLSGSMPLEQENAKNTKKGGVNSILSGSMPFKS